jgi:hypothetical protein
MVGGTPAKDVAREQEKLEKNKARELNRANTELTLATFPSRSMLPLPSRFTSTVSSPLVSPLTLHLGGFLPWLHLPRPLLLSFMHAATESPNILMKRREEV